MMMWTCSFLSFAWKNQDGKKVDCFIVKTITSVKVDPLSRLPHVKTSLPCFVKVLDAIKNKVVP